MEAALKAFITVIIVVIIIVFIILDQINKNGGKPSTY